MQTYTDGDFWLTEALEADPAVMRELGGPVERDKLPEIDRRRLADPWWFKIVAEPGGPAVGTIGVWETRHGDEDLHETGWMVLPAHQGRGIAPLVRGADTADRLGGPHRGERVRQDGGHGGAHRPARQLHAVGR